MSGKYYYVYAANVTSPVTSIGSSIVTFCKSAASILNPEKNPVPENLLCVATLSVNSQENSVPAVKLAQCADKSECNTPSKPL